VALPLQSDGATAGDPVPRLIRHRQQSRRNMSGDLKARVSAICSEHDSDAGRMIDIARAVQAEFGCVSEESVGVIADWTGATLADVESCVSFYSFLSSDQEGKVVIRVSDDVPDRMAGFERVLNAFADELGIQPGETTEDGAFTLETTACIGLSDQAPGALINDVPFTNLSSDKAREIVRELRRHMDPRRLVHKEGDGNNAHPLIHSMVRNNSRGVGAILYTPYNRGEAVRKALSISPKEVIRAIKTARLRGRGGAGFPAGMKWEFARNAPGEQKYVICNADEGEPGTFKDRVLLTERSDRLFAGMTIAGYAIGATKGIIYLRAEYKYLRAFLEEQLTQRRVDGLLGESILGHEGFDFDVRIQMGAGAYVCGEETALIASCLGERGDPWNRPPFPAQEGYRGSPTIVNNVETLCCVTKILEDGPATFCEYGTRQSAGTKLLSISGDCLRPGVYEVPFGATLGEVLDMCGAEEPVAVQVGGPSGQMVGEGDFDRTICFDDLPTGGSMMVFGPDRDLLEIAENFMDFFVEESCGYCTPCRVGNVLLRETLRRIRSSLAEPQDLENLESLGETVKKTSRCGLGQTSPNPILSTLSNFRHLYEERVSEAPDGQRRSFDLDRAVQEAVGIVGRAAAGTGAPREELVTPAALERER
jgi:[NiFe] hydrogenase diaphorase moiety large subunit